MTNQGSHHIFRDFDQAIQSLKNDIVNMTAFTRQNVERAMQALLQRNVDLAKAVIADDTEVDDLQMKIDREGMEMLVRFHPVASDLRFVIASMRIAASLERISDHAVNIAKRAKKLYKEIEIEEVKLCEPLYTAAESILRDAITSFTDHNETLGASLKEKDKELDRLHKKLVKNFSAGLENANGRTTALLHLIFVARSLERIGDLAVNIGEDAVFLEVAKDIRHEHHKES